MVWALWPLKDGDRFDMGRVNKHINHTTRL
ncbi:MAG: hypothetical protein RIQ29_60 [Pseudomonadota bacterium]|jgi:hypothetical protein